MKMSFGITSKDCIELTGAFFKVAFPRPLFFKVTVSCIRFFLLYN